MSSGTRRRKRFSKRAGGKTSRNGTRLGATTLTITWAAPKPSVVSAAPSARPSSPCARNDGGAPAPAALARVARMSPIRGCETRARGYKMQAVNHHDASELRQPSDPVPAANAIPAAGIPPVLTSSPRKARKRSWMIAIIGGASLVVLLAVGALVRAGASEARPAKSEPGISYTNTRVASVPWSIHVLKIDRSRKDLAFFSAHAKERVLGVSLIADQARAVPREIGHAIAGVNGDFYVRDRPPYNGDPRGLQIVNGELISGPDTVCIWFDAKGNPHLDEVKGEFNVTWPDGRKTAFDLNQQRKPNSAVLFTPTYGASTLTFGGRDLILERDEKGPWLPLQAGQAYRARVREIATNGNTRLPDRKSVV